MASQVTEEPNPVNIMGSINILKVNLDSISIELTGRRGFPFGRITDVYPIAPIINVLPTAEATATIIERIVDGMIVEFTIMS
jgi:hypothetical protein